MSREIISLNRDWKYAKKFEENYANIEVNESDFEIVNVPHCNQEVPYNYFDEKMYQFVSCYRKTLSISDKFKGKRIFVDFEGVMTYAKVYFNGLYLGEHKGGYTPFSFELTDHVKFNENNVLAVMVDSTERADIPPFGNEVDYLTFGGVYREVNLRVVEKTFIENAFLKPKKVLESKKDLEVSLFLNNEDCKEEKYELNVAISDNQKVIKDYHTEITVSGKKNSTLDVLVENLEGIKLWNIENPNLYNVTISLCKNGQIVDTFESRIGFREPILKEDGFYLNGEKVKLRGLNRHQSFPYVGYAMPERVQKKDADILKYDLNLNLVRTSHYPQSRHFLDRCDEIGLLVFEEIPGWQHIGNEAWKEVACENVREMITRDWNHPSIFLWGVRINESGDDHDFYVKTNKIAHSLDHTRQTAGVRCMTNSELLEDVYTMNDFCHCGEELVLRDQQKVTGLDKKVPYLVTEFCGHIYPTKRFDQEERIIEHAMRHLRVQNKAALEPNISGAIGWCAFDYNTHCSFGSGDRICYHGVMDMFRIPKFAAKFYKSQVKPSKEIILEPLTLWARGDRNKGTLSPLVVFTNCDTVKLYINKKLAGEYKPDFQDYKGLEFPPVIINQIGGEWGGSWDDSEFVGYINGKEVARKCFARNPIPTALVGTADDNELLADRSDATRVVYKLVDRQGNPLPYIPEYIEFEIKGPGEIVGPKKTTLIGGCIAVWVKSKYEKGEIILSAKCSKFSAEDIRIEVK